MLMLVYASGQAKSGLKWYMETNAGDANVLICARLN